MTVFKTAVTVPGLSEAIQEAYSTAGKFLYSNEKYLLGIEDAEVSIETVPINGKDTLHISFAWDLDWEPPAEPRPLKVYDRDGDITEFHGGTDATTDAYGRLRVSRGDKVIAIYNSDQWTTVLPA